MEISHISKYLGIRSPSLWLRMMLPGFLALTQCRHYRKGKSYQKQALKSFDYLQKRIKRHRDFSIQRPWIAQAGELPPQSRVSLGSGLAGRNRRRPRHSQGAA